MNNSDNKISVQNSLNILFSKLSSGFAELKELLRKSGISDDSKSVPDKLFNELLQSAQSVANDIRVISENMGKIQRQLEQLGEEKRRLQVLYSSGILFSSETEKKALLEIAIDTVVRELKADAGFIILASEGGEPEETFAKNMNPDEKPDALRMSTTVLKNTIAGAAPVQVNDTADDSELANKFSIVKLGISSVLCVPLISGKKVLGTVYLDRRNKDNPFTHTDLVFLLSFAKQIVKGLEISQQFFNLERKLLTDSILKFDDLRKEFRCENIIGKSPKLFEVLKLAAKVSPTDASVLILGENGTGKDLLARAIHKNSRRKDKPFITIDCGSIPPDLLESELFGYESGAFTGANKTKPGKLELADGGTLFFDEIGELNINLQAKLLRVIQTKEFERLGSVNTRKINVRIISATNKDINQMIKSAQFREDLYYRLKVIEIVIPPLRERKEDIEELVRVFIEKHSPHGKRLSISAEALEILENYSWPGNIRELENIILRCTVLAKDDIIKAEDLPEEIRSDVQDMINFTTSKTLPEAEYEFRKMYVLKVLRQSSSKSEAAKKLGINRTHFYKLLNQLGIRY
ncbi:MAG: sigma-54-dependent Fis family transcriptional regulator [Ignavibacteriaceae bacterium]